MQNLYKIFYSIKNDKLHENLHSLGFEGHVFRLIQAFIQQRLKTNWETIRESERNELYQGVPRLLLFNAYINDLHKHIHYQYNVVQYVDDSSVHASSLDNDIVYKKHKNYREKLACYFDKNIRHRNTSETVFIAFCKKGKNYLTNTCSATTSGETLKKNNSVNYLRFSPSKKI